LSAAILPPPLRVRDLSKTYDTDAGPVPVLAEVNFEVRGGESVALVGPSGSGKSTLLHLLGTLDRPSAGHVEIDGRDPFGLPEAELARFRNRTVGFVFQDHHLLPQYSVLENVLLPTLAFPQDRGEAKAVAARAEALLERVGLSHRRHHRPSQLSGGERQRGALARALIQRPTLLLCDEPTGNLDQATAGKVADLLFELHGQESPLLVIVTHSPELARRCDRRLALKEGRCVEA
jgi:lipoprotein-releasing system ATP-binding protein